MEKIIAICNIGMLFSIIMIVIALGGLATSIITMIVTKEIEKELENENF